MHLKTGYEEEMGGNNETVSKVAVSRRHVTESAKKSKDGARIATTRKRHSTHRAASIYICL